MRAFDAAIKSVGDDQRGDIPGCVNIAVGIVLRTQSVVTGEVADSYLLHTGEINIPNGDGGLVLLQRFHTGAAIRIGDRNLIVATIRAIGIAL